MNTITNTNVEKGIATNTNKKTMSKAVKQGGSDIKVSKKDTFEYSEHSQSNNIVYSKPNVTTNSASASGGIYDSANYYSTSISLSQMAAQRANAICTSGGSPVSGRIYGAIYSASLIYLQNFTPIETYNHYSKGNIGKGSVEDTIFTYDHQYFLAVQALQDCGLAKNESTARTMMDSDPFYEKAARVLSYMDNGIPHTSLNVNYSSLDVAMPNIQRWRNAVATGS